MYMLKMCFAKFLVEYSTFNGLIQSFTKAATPSRWNLSKFVAQFKTFRVRISLSFRCFSIPLHFKIRVLLRYFAGK